MNIFSKLIGGTSPFEMLSEHLGKAMECVDLVMPLLEAALDEDNERLDEIAKKVFKLEREADEIKLSLRDSLPKARLLPVARPDLLAYLKEQDNLADKVEDLAIMLTVRHFMLPGDYCAINFRGELMALATEAVEAAKHAAKMFERINELKRVAFSGKASKEIREGAAKVSQHEHEADKHQFRLVRCILAIDDPSWHFAASYSLMEVVRALSKLANHAESMSDYMRLMVAD